MGLDAKREKELWESWLGPKFGDKLKVIRRKVTDIYDENREKDGELPFYTPHGPEHCAAVENLLHRLLPQDSYEKLEERERFYLLASAWIHDLGMLPSVAKQVLKTNSLSYPEIRKRHHFTVENFVVEHYSRCGLQDEDKVFISKLCRYHRRQEDINNCNEVLTVQNVTYRLRLLAAYLRLADSLHVDSSRVPDSAYAICLAYDISTESKLHWIKSKIVNGIHIDSKEHAITVEFRIPDPEQLIPSVEPDWARYKIDYIIKLVLDDLRTELSSIMNVLTRGGPTYYLDIIKDEVTVCLNDQVLNDLLELIMNFDILVAPSASKLLEMILVTVSNISGYHIRRNDKPTHFKFDHATKEDRQKRVCDFLNKLNKEILNRRPCHFGLKSMIQKCQDAGKDLPGNFDKFINEINMLYQKHFECRQDIRKNSTNFLETLIHESTDIAAIFDNNNHTEFNILLYGYSELVIRALCGFRDYLIKREVNCPNCDLREFFGSNVEKRISNRIRVFICDGQPKTQTAAGDRLLYHDGTQYAFALEKRGFRNIVLIPDIVVGNAIEHNAINLVMVGANGFTNQYFKHAAGHSSVINLVREYRTRNKAIEYPKVTLVVSSEKWLRNPDEDKNSKDRQKHKAYDGDPFRFWQGSANRNTREHVWIMHDKTLCANLQGKDITFYNPREDIVRMDSLDYIISNTGFYTISSAESSSVMENIDIFIQETEKERNGSKD